MNEEILYEKIVLYFGESFINKLKVAYTTNTVGALKLLVIEEFANKYFKDLHLGVEPYDFILENDVLELDKIIELTQQGSLKELKEYIIKQALNFLDLDWHIESKMLESRKEEPLKFIYEHKNLISLEETAISEYIAIAIAKGYNIYSLTATDIEHIIKDEIIKEARRGIEEVTSDYIDMVSYRLFIINSFCNAKSSYLSVYDI